jgi:hypothetical protein
MKARPLLLTLLALTITFAPLSPRSALATEQVRQYSAKLVSPKAGAVVRSGNVVNIEWTAKYPDVDVSMCETELLLSLDGGQTFNYISSQRNPKIRHFDWTVPSVPAGTTVTAILDIRFGCLALYPETTSIQYQSTFVISGD